MKRKPFAVAAAIVILAGCTKPAENAAGGDNAAAGDPAVVAQVRDAWAAAWKAGNAAQLAALYEENATDMTNHMPTSAGRAAIEAAFVNQFAQVTPSDITLIAEQTEVNGDFAYDRGTFSFTMTPKAGGAPMVENGRYLVVLKRQADNSWKLVEVMGNSATPLPGTPGAPATAQ
jgi:uncharacterized protein (TIGR02246 family)